MNDNTHVHLDPDDWGELQALGRRAVDDMLEYLRGRPNDDAWRPVPDAVRDRIRNEPIPWEPQGEERVYEEFKALLLPYPYGNTHPRFWGWVASAGIPYGAIADFVASALNTIPSGFQQTPEHVERQVVDWTKELLGFPRTASGLLNTGSSVANFIALAAARNARLSGDANARGLLAGGEQLCYYVSEETHACVAKAVQLLGVGTDHLRVIPVGDDYRMDTGALEAAIREDRAGGLVPCCIVGTAGTVDQGVIDDLDTLADIAARHDVWLHVDGAFGAAIAASEKLRHRVRGIERADSLALDYHKWFSMPYAAAITLVRDPAAHRDPFAFKASYLSVLEGGVAATDYRFADYGPELSREFRALKVWMCFKAIGLRRFVRIIEQNVEHAQRLVRLIDDEPSLERLAPAPLNIVCFRYRADHLSTDDHNELTKRIVIRIQESGFAVPSHTVNKGRVAIRVGICNHRTRPEDLDLFVREVVRVGELESRAFRSTAGAK